MWECKKKPKKPVASHLDLEAKECSDFGHAEIHCVCPKSPKCPKSTRAKIRTN